jgi:hypothetical protein
MPAARLTPTASSGNISLRSTNQAKAKPHPCIEAIFSRGIMSLSSTFDTVNSQLECQLLQAPYDIRREILNYLVPSSVHVFHTCGRLELSECVGCPQVSRYGVGEERQQGLLDNDPYRQERLARRLVSSWGPHWKCEEMMLQTRDIRNHDTDESCDTMGALMRTCKKL